MIGPAHPPPACRRFDLSTPVLVFGGLLITATAVRALDMSASTGVYVEEVKVAADQYTVSPKRLLDPVALSCESRQKVSASRAEAQQRCRAEKRTLWQ